VIRVLSELRISDVLDVIIVAALLWMLIVWLRTTNARFAAIGLGILAALYLLVQQLELQLTVWLFQGFFAAVVCSSSCSSRSGSSRDSLPRSCW